MKKLSDVLGLSPIEFLAAIKQVRAVEGIDEYRCTSELLEEFIFCALGNMSSASTQSEAIAAHQLLIGLVKLRSPEQVRRIEIKKGLAQGGGYQ